MFTEMYNRQNSNCPQWMKELKLQNVWYFCLKIAYHYEKKSLTCLKKHVIWGHWSLIGYMSIEVLWRPAQEELTNFANTEFSGYKSLQ